MILSIARKRVFSKSHPCVRCRCVKWGMNRLPVCMWRVKDWRGGDLPVLGGRTKPSCTWRTAAGEDDDAGFGLFVTPCDCEYKGRGDRGVNMTDKERCFLLLINMPI